MRYLVVSGHRAGISVNGQNTQSGRIIEGVSLADANKVITEKFARLKVGEGGSSDSTHNYMLNNTSVFL